MTDSNQHSEPDEPVLSDYIDLEAYDVVPGPQYRRLLEQFDALRKLSTDVRDAWTISDAHLGPLLEACQALDNWLVRYAATSNPASVGDSVMPEAAALITRDSRGGGTESPASSPASEPHDA